ncbi:MAG: hypothetical protein IPO22_01270 [Anaerolineales bacterium]|jgi:hypothetical protein|nr:hypothetical protein [Anaerolineales bacterium]
MRKILFISLALMLAACGVVQPVQQEQATPIIATVLVTVIAPTEVVPPTAVPLPTQAPTEIPTLAPTETLAPTATTAATNTAAPASAGVQSSDLTPVYVDNTLGKGVFTNIAFSSDLITLNCYPREFEITMTALHPDVTRAEMYYRVLEAPSFFRYSDWYLVGNLNSDGKGGFYTTFKATDISPDWRSLDQAVIEFQFVGVNKGGGTVDRTQKIERLVSYYKECP